MPKVKTVVSAIRAITGLKVKEFADMVGKSVATVQSWESGRLELSLGAAYEIAIETGVNADWLRVAASSGRSAFVPITDDLQPFTEITFIKHRSKKIAGFKVDNDVIAKSYVAQLAGILRAALVDGRSAEAFFQTSVFLSRLKSSFGIDATERKQVARRLEIAALGDPLFYDFYNPVEGVTPAPTPKEPTPSRRNRKKR